MPVQPAFNDLYTITPEGTPSLAHPPDLPPSDPPSPTTPTLGTSTRRVIHDELGSFELSTDFEMSSPIRTAADSRRKQKSAREEKKRLEEQSRQRREHNIYDEILTTLGREDGCSFGGLLEYVSDPTNWKGAAQFEGLFSDDSRVKRILNAWTSSGNSAKGRQSVRNWALEYVKKVLRSEGNEATRTKFLQSQSMSIDQTFVLEFSLRTLHSQLREHCPVAMDLFEAYSTTTRQDRELEENSKRKKEICVTMQALIALGTRSQNNNYMKSVLALYLYASGASRQVIAVLSHLGITSSYPSIAGRHRDSNTIFDNVELPEAGPSKSIAHLIQQSSQLPDSATVTEPNPAKKIGVSSSDVQDDWYWDSFDNPDEPPPGPSSAATTTLSAQAPVQSSNPPLPDPTHAEAGPHQAPPSSTPETMPSGSDSLPPAPSRSVPPPASTSAIIPEARVSSAAKDNTHATPTTQQDGESGTTSQPNPPSKPGKLRLILAAYGLIKRLSHACRQNTREMAKRFPMGYVYDNINMLFRIAEQILGRKDSQQNGTCATAFKLFEADEEDMHTADLLKSLSSAPPLCPEDILLTPQETSQLRERLIHTVLRIIITYGGESFARFREDVMNTTSATSDKINIHKTEIFPLPAMNIDESSITGNADVLKEIFAELHQDIASPEFTKLVKLIAGDQLSVSRIRSIIANRAGHTSFAQSFLWAICVPGLFHYKMTATHGLLEHHFGSSSTTNPASLAFHNTLLDRKPIVLSSLPPFRTCRDLIFVSAYARVLHCLELVSNCASLDEYGRVVDFAQLKDHASKIVDQFANPEVAHKARRQREAEMRTRQADVNARTAAETATERTGADTAAQPPPAPFTSGDAVFENAILFLRDALVLHEFTDAVKTGDSGRVVLVLRLWALAFRGNGRTKYAHEMLHLIHNLTHVWPEPLRKIILKNWLVNPTGRPDAWVEVDLMQEHLNFWIKTIYKAHGSNASWEWLAMVSPCIDILHRLATHINRDLGAHQGSKHTSPSLEKDLQVLRDSLAEHQVYVQVPGRVIPSESDKPGFSGGAVPYAVALGWNQLTAPLADFNTQLKRLQRRCVSTPLAAPAYTTRRDATPEPAPVDTPSGPSLARPPTSSALTPPSVTAVISTAPIPAALEQVGGSGVPPDDAPEDEEEDYWGAFEDIESSERVPFSLETPGDVALDMDLIEADVDDVEDV